MFFDNIVQWCNSKVIVTVITVKIVPYYTAYWMKYIIQH